jgi:aspartate/glutamate racemase
MKKLGLIHTVSGLVPTFAELAAELLPQTETTVIVDELLLKRTVQDGSIDELTRDRLASHVAALAAFGVDEILVTCSSVGGVVDEIAATAIVPVARVDRAMAQRAVSLGPTIGVLATLSTTLTPTTALVESSARASGRVVTVVPRLCEGAFEALSGGDRDLHDAIVGDQLERLAAEVDVVVLAQASMARVAATRSVGATPVLSSPRLAMEALASRAS